MIQDLTLEQISIAVVFIVGLIGGVRYLKNAVRDFLKKLLEDQFNIVNTKLDEMDISIKKLDVQTSKNFLIRYLADIERGENIYESEKQRFWDEYKHYKDDLKENAYITEWVDRLKKEGKL